VPGARFLHDGRQTQPPRCDRPFEWGGLAAGRLLWVQMARLL
jgi:hypothetical protein